MYLVHPEPTIQSVEEPDIPQKVHSVNLELRQCLAIESRAVQLNLVLWHLECACNSLPTRCKGIVVHSLQCSTVCFKLQLLLHSKMQPLHLARQQRPLFWPMQCREFHCQWRCIDHPCFQWPKWTLRPVQYDNWPPTVHIFLTNTVSFFILQSIRSSSKSLVAWIARMLGEKEEGILWSLFLNSTWQI